MKIAAAAVAALLTLASAHDAAAQAPAGDAKRGEQLFFDRACWQCHGLGAQGGGAAGPRLAGRVQAWAAFAPYVRRPTEEMIPYTRKVLSDQELADIFAWLVTFAPPSR